MRRNSTLYFIAFFAFVILPFNNSFSQTTYVNNGTSANYNLNTGDSLFISSGTYTGNISSFKEGAKITIAEGASFQPSLFNNPKGILINNGSCKFNNDLRSNDGFTVSNFGTFWATKAVELNGNNQVWTNHYGASFKFDKGAALNNNNSITNKGTFTSAGTITLNGTSMINNRNIINITGSFTLNSSSSILNEGKLDISESATFNTSVAINNTCRLIAGNGITNNSTINNSGLIWAKNGSGSTIVNNGSGTIYNSSTGKIKAVNFTNYGILKGAGFLYFTGTTYNSGTTGVVGITADTIKVYDVTRSNPLTIFDTQWGSVRPNTAYTVFAAPDTTNNFASCSSEALSAIPLPIKWNYFYVNVAANVPSLLWSATQDAGTIFEIQRSYNGSDYNVVTTTTAITDNKTNYNAEDRNVNTLSSIVYYRIKATEPSGSVKYSETRTIKFSNKNGATIQAVPNPFTSQLTINYQSSERAALTIKGYSLNGQLLFTKNTVASNGYNSIAITEAGSLSKGVYILQVLKNNELISTERIIKQ